MIMCLIIDIRHGIVSSHFHSSAALRLSCAETYGDVTLERIHIYTVTRIVTARVVLHDNVGADSGWIQVGRARASPTLRCFA